MKKLLGESFLKIVFKYIKRKEKLIKNIRLKKYHKIIIFPGCRPYGVIEFIDGEFKGPFFFDFSHILPFAIFAQH